jgi:hypothetical protein
MLFPALIAMVRAIRGKIIVITMSPIVRDKSDLTVAASQTDADHPPSALFRATAEPYHFSSFSRSFGSSI